jgi:hypothetical protein
MAMLHLPARLFFAVGSAVIIVGAPAIAALATPTASDADHTVADSIHNCTATQKSGSASLNCRPNPNVGPPGGQGGVAGLPSESALTQQNSHR